MSRALTQLLQKRSVRSVRTYSVAALEVLSALKNPDLVKTVGFVNGSWVSGSQTYSIYDPGNTENKVADVTSLDTTHFNSAIESAHAAFGPFKKTTGRYRSQLLFKLYQQMMENQEDLAKIIVVENGKPLADAMGEIAYAASYFQWFSEEAARVGGDVIPSATPGSKILAIRQPVGPCALVTPWNFPSAMITRKLGALLAAGCTAVIKPAHNTALSALALGELCEKAEVPKGVVNILPTTLTEDVGKLLCEHKLIKKVSLTGSTRLGKVLMSQLASTLKKVSFELGGNAPFIVFEDADIDKAVQGAMALKFRSSGQTCVCANRIFVHESVYDEFAAKFVELVEKTVLGHGLDKETTHGPLNNSASLEKVKHHIKDATSLGAKVLTGGQSRPDIGELFHELTVLGDVTSKMAIFHEETFGPVAPLIKFSSDEEVVAMANDTDVGLAGYFYSQDISKVFKVAEELEVGMLGVNTGAISEPALPFGGVKESGFGREGSKYGVDEYTVVKSMVIGS